MSGFSASPAQRLKVRDAACIVCASPAPSDPAHVIPRSLGGKDHHNDVVPLCRRCHGLYDTGELDLLPFLEPWYRREQERAVELVGIAAAYRRITNTRTPGS